MAGPVLTGNDVLTVAAAAIRAGPDVAASLSKLLWQRRRRNDVAASLKPAVAAVARRCGVPEAWCCGTPGAMLHPCSCGALATSFQSVLTQVGQQTGVRPMGLRGVFFFPPSHETFEFWLKLCLLVAATKLMATTSGYRAIDSVQGYPDLSTRDVATWTHQG